jgi:hypothetical protein
MAPLLAQTAQTITSSTGLELGLVASVGVALLALGGWSAILRHRQDDNGRVIRRLVKRVESLEDDRTAREAVKAYKAGREPDAPRQRPGDSSGSL